MNLLNDIQYIVSKIRNTGNTAEGSTLSPRQQGPFRVPFVSGFQLVQQGQTPSGHPLLTFIFTPPPDPEHTIDQYEIHAFVPGQSTNAFVVGSTSTSPITVEMQSVAAPTPYIFYCQTYLKSGLASDLLSSPTCTATLVPLIQSNQIILDINGTTITIGLGVDNGVITPGIFVSSDANPQAQAVIEPTAIFLYNKNQKIAAIMNTDAGTNLAGQIQLFDGTGAGGLGNGKQLVLDGKAQGNINTLGIIKFSGFTKDATARALQGYIPVIVDAAGTTYYTPLYL